MALKRLNQSRLIRDIESDSSRVNTTNSELGFLAPGLAIRVTVESQRKSVIADS